MKLFLVLAAVAARALSQQIQFVNTSFADAVSVGDLWTISWTIEANLPVSLAIGNSTWSYPIFSKFHNTVATKWKLTLDSAQQPVLPNMYSWVIPDPADFTTGEYQLSLRSYGAPVEDVTYSPVFVVNVPEGPQTTFATPTTTLPPATNTGVVATVPAGTGAMSTVTLTYVYWDHECGCTKTNTAASPLNTGMAATTYTWYEDECACTKSAVVPVSTMPTTWTNYTAPLNPPTMKGTAAATPMTTAAASPAGTTTAARVAPFSGASVKTRSSLLGLVALVAAAVLT